MEGCRRVGGREPHIVEPHHLVPGEDGSVHECQSHRMAGDEIEPRGGDRGGRGERGGGDVGAIGTRGVAEAVPHHVHQ